MGAHGLASRHRWQGWQCWQSGLDCSRLPHPTGFQWSASQLLLDPKPCSWPALTRSGKLTAHRPGLRPAPALWRGHAQAGSRALAPSQLC